MGQSGVANAAPVGSDRDGLTNAQEKVTVTSPYKADSDGERVRDADEDRDRDGVDNSDEFRVSLRANDASTDDDRLLDGDENADGDALANEDEDETRRTSLRPTTASPGSRTRPTTTAR